MNLRRIFRFSALFGVWLLLFAVMGGRGAIAGDFSGSTKNGPLVILDNDGKTLQSYYWNSTERSLAGTGFAGTVVDDGDHWRIQLLSGALAGRILCNTGLEIQLGGGELGISCHGGGPAIEAHGGLIISGPGVLHIDQYSGYSGIHGGGKVSIVLGAIVGVNSLGDKAGIVASGVQVLASALHVNATENIGIDCGNGGLTVSESILTVGALKAAVYTDESTGDVTVTASSVHLMSSAATALQSGTGIIAGGSTISVANSVFCALGADHGIYAGGAGLGARLVFNNVVGTILGGDCGIYPAGEIFVSGGSTKLSVAGNIFGEHSPDEVDVGALLQGEDSSGQAIRMQSPSRSYFQMDAGSVKLFSPGVCGLVCATNVVLGGSLEVSGEASYGDFQTLFTWQGALAAAEIVAGNSMFKADDIIADFFETQAFAGFLGPTAALFAAGKGRPITGIKADMLYVEGGKVSVEASGTGIQLGTGYGAPCARLTQKGGEVSVDAGLVAIMDWETSAGYTLYQTDAHSIWVTGGRLFARGRWDGILTCGYVFQEGGTIEVVVTGGNEAGTISDAPYFMGYAVSANMIVGIEGGSFVATGGAFRPQPQTSGSHGPVWVYPCDLEVAGGGGGAAIVVTNMVPEWYGVNDLYPIGGIVRFWLPAGKASLVCGGRAYTANETGMVAEGENRFIAEVISGSPVALSVTGPESVAAGGTAVYSCVASYSDGTNATVEATWSVAAGEGYGHIDERGTFMAAETSDGGTVTICAAYGGLSAEKIVSVSPASPPPSDEKWGIFAYDCKEGTCNVAFSVEDGKTYCLQRAGMLGGVWVTIARVKALQSGAVALEDVLPAGTRSGFYRLAEGEETAKDLYMVVDMSGGRDADTWPVTYLDSLPEGGWTYEHKTTKLVLRRIEAGTFTMGSPESELGRNENEIQHEVTLTKPYYIGVFEVTQRQWELAMGNRPSTYKNEDVYATRPVETVSFVDIRGATSGLGWPATDGVDEDSFLGVLRKKTGLAFTLPTEAEWEYACRAGAGTALNSGLDLTSTNVCPHMAAVGRYVCNGGEYRDSLGDTTQGTAAVGSYAPNAWGVYDMHGNVWEWCLDWMDDYAGEAVSDPVGPAEATAVYGPMRVLRGGSAGTEVRGCRSAVRGAGTENQMKGSDFGFRIRCRADSGP